MPRDFSKLNSFLPVFPIFFKLPSEIASTSESCFLGFSFITSNLLVSYLSVFKCSSFDVSFCFGVLPPAIGYVTAVVAVSDPATLVANETDLGPDCLFCFSSSFLMVFQKLNMLLCLFNYFKISQISVTCK